MSLAQPEYLSGVSSLYGPGLIGGWFCTITSFIITNALIPEERKQGKFSNDLLFILTIPVAASGHALYCFAASISAGKMPPESVAKIAAALSVCNAYIFVSSALIFAISSPEKEISKRVATVIPTVADDTQAASGSLRASFMSIVGNLCYLTSVCILCWTSIRCMKEGFADKDALIHLRPPTVSILTTAISVSTAILVTYYRIRSENHYRTPTKKWLDIAFIPINSFSNISFDILMLVHHGRNMVHGRYLFFLPQTACSIRDIDQWLSLLVGLITILFSIRDVIQTRRQSA
ncbi:hypothetical protein EJ04DRAFT_554065 [Polyplosphaeria fusca]|uniref:Uncharacterized protein n=1 Tax=Polyplosphaeria fusca TaxID=682080 RepID=A0A9P4V0Q7_9PLEO|nr:hypothetical protein EJ04DRAFT_554065 [Polyplosphaeria fusca]